MTERTFIEEPDLVKKTLDQLDSVGISTGYNSELYVNPKDGQQWERYEFELNGNDAFGLRKYPYPDLDKTIKMVLHSKFMDEVDGACGLLHHLELNSRTEFREVLLNAISVNGVGRVRFEIIYERTELSDSSNKRDVLGKTLDEVEIDAQYFQNLTARANELKNKIAAASNTIE